MKSFSENSPGVERYREGSIIIKLFLKLIKRRINKGESIPPSPFYRYFFLTDLEEDLDDEEDDEREELLEDELLE